MAVSRKCLIASAKARKAGVTKCGYRAVLAEGERAAVAGKSITDNPYGAGSEDAATWAEGFEDMKAVA